MPNIVEYTSKSGLNPSDKGINAAQDAARVYIAAGKSIAGDIRDVADAAVRHMSIMETSELYKTGTDFKINRQRVFEEESAKPENRGDPTFGDRFMAETDALLKEWQDSAGTEHGKQLAATMGASIRNEVFNYVSAGQAEMDFAHVDDNHTQTVNGLASSLIADPSVSNLNRTLGTISDANQGITALIPDVSMRERALTEWNHRDRNALVVARYEGVANAIKNQIAESGGDTSPAFEQLKKEIADPKTAPGFQYLSPEQQTKVMDLAEHAVSQGQELFNSRHATAKAQLKEEGQQAYAEIHSEITRLTLQGLPPTPELVAKAQQFSNTYGAILPGEVAGVDDFLISSTTKAVSNTVQPFNQNVRDNIQAGFSLPKGDPRRPTQASLLQAYSHGQITKEDFTGYTEILGKLDKPENDPAFKAAWDNFVRWRNSAAASIGGNDLPGTEAARSRFINDVTNNFMARGHAMNDWDRALERVTNPNIPGNFANNVILGIYQKAANRPDAGSFLNNRLPRWNPDNTLTWPSGNGGGRKPLGTAPAIPNAPPPKPVSPAEDLQKADEILWGKH